MSRKRATAVRQSGDPRRRAVDTASRQAQGSDPGDASDTTGASGGEGARPGGGRRAKHVRAWLDTEPSLEELQEAFPQEWQRVASEMSAVAARGDAEAVKAHVRAVARGTTPGPVDPRAARRGSDAVIAEEVRRRMLAAALRRQCFSLATGVEEGRVRFNLLNGWVAQRLLFRRDLERKPASMFWFRLLWPLLWQRRRLMPLVGPKGIYCFYSKQLVRALADMIGDRPCLEIAAGDGTLSRFLADAGVDVVATDDYSWSHAVDFPDTVQRLDAKAALARYEPKVVVCSWPPADNSFERAVFATRSVELYIVISSRHEFGSGNWEHYRSQTEFTLAKDDALSALVLPPEIDGAVYLFHRGAS